VLGRKINQQINWQIKVAVQMLKAGGHGAINSRISSTELQQLK